MSTRPADSASAARSVSGTGSASTEPIVAAVDGVTVESVTEFVAAEWPAAPPATCHEISGRHAVLSLPVSADTLRPGGYISGPTQFTAADLVLWFGCFGSIGLEAMAVTSELSIRFLRPAFGGLLWARADVSSVGRRSIAGSVSVWTDDPDKPTALAQGTYARPPSL